MIGLANGRPISITGLGCYVPERVLTNHDLAQMVDTSDEWIVERTGIRERRIAAPHEAMSDLALPASLRALEQVRGPVGRGKATARVGDELAARGTLTFAVER